MSRPSRLGHQASLTFESIPQTTSTIAPPAWLVLPLLYWSQFQLACLQAVEPYLVENS